MEVLKAHLRKFIMIGEDEFSEVAAFFKSRQAGRKENLLVEGQICKFNYFVVKGCLRKFFINDKGTEQTTEFAIENWWMTDLFAFESQLKTPFHIQAVETTEVLYIDKHQQDALLGQHPVMEKYFRYIYQKAYAAAQMRLMYFHNYSREALYHHFRKRQPEFLQRVPQYLIASYLGFTPEYLSEIRKKKFS